MPTLFTDRQKEDAIINDYQRWYHVRCTSHNALLPMGYFVQVVMLVVGDETHHYYQSCIFGVSSLMTFMTTCSKYPIGSNVLWEISPRIYNLLCVIELFQVNWETCFSFLSSNWFWWHPTHFCLIPSHGINSVMQLCVVLWHSYVFYMQNAVFYS